MTDHSNFNASNASKMLSSKEAAKRLGIASDYVSKLCREGKLDGIRGPGGWSVSESSLKRYAHVRNSANTERSQKLSELRKQEQQQYKKINPGEIVVEEVTITEDPVALTVRKTPLAQYASLSVGIAFLFAAIVFAGGNGIDSKLFSGATQPAALARVNSPFFGSIPSVVEPSANTGGNFLSGLYAMLFGQHQSQPTVAQVQQPVPQTQTTPVVAVVPTAPVTPTKPSQPTQTIIQQNTYPVTERTIVQTTDGISQTDLDQQLAALSDNLKQYVNSQISSAPATNSYGGGGTVITNEALSQRIDQLSGITITGGTISGAAISGGTITNVSVSATNLSDIVAIANGGTGTTTAPSLGDLLVGNASGGYDLLHQGSNGQVLKVLGGHLVWGFDTSGGGGGGAWATTTDGLAIYPADPSQVVIIGDSATTTTGNILEVAGNAFFRNQLTVSGAGFFASASTTNLTVSSVSGSLLKTLANGAVVAAVAGTDYQAAGNYATFSYPFPANATTTAIAFNGGATISSLTLGTALTVPNGGTGVATTPTFGQLLLGNNLGGYTLTATSSLGLLSSSSLSAQYPLAYNSTTGVFSTSFSTTTTNTFNALNTFVGGLIATNATTTNATTTNLAITGTLNVGITGATQCLHIDAAGNVSGTGVDCGVGSSSFGYPFPGNATTTQIAFNGGATFVGATTTALTVTGSTTINTLNLSNALAIANGGTGTSTAPAFGQLLIGNGAGGYSLVATSSLGIVASGNSSTFGTTSISALAPLNWNTSTAQLSITQSGLASNGYLSSVDFNTFNNKISSTSLSATYPLAYNSTTGVFTTAFGTTTANTFSALQTFNGGIVANTATTTNLAVTGSTTIGTLNLSNALGIAFGGTGTSTAPTYGQLLLGNANGTYDLVSTSSLGITGTGSSFAYPFPGNATTTQIAFNGGATFAGATTTALQIANLASTTNLVVSGLGGSGTTCVQADSSGKLSSTGAACGTGSGAVNSVSNSDGTLSISPTTGAVVASLNLGHANTFTALQQFNAGASTTLFSASAAFFGSSATTTIDSAGNLSVAGNTTLHNATSTNFAITGVTSALLKTLSNGAIVAATPGVDYQAAGNYATFGYLFPGNATTTAIAFNGGATFAGATTTALAVNGSTTISSILNVGGAINANGGVVGTLTGNASTATALQTGRTINGVTFDGTANIVINAASSTLLANTNTFSGPNSFTNGLTANVLAVTTSASIASTTLAGNTLLANATTSNFAITNVPSALLKTLSNGAVVAAIAGTDYLTSANVFGYPFPGNATTTQIAFNGGATFVGATTTALAVNGSTTITGVLNLGTALSVANGGTGSTTLSGLLVGNGTSGVQTAVVSSPLTFSGSTLAIQQATLAQNGYLSSADFATFNGKLGSTSLSGTYPVQYNSSTGAISLAFGTTTANTWSALNTFNGGLLAASSTLQNFTAFNSTTTNATTTNLAITNVPSALLKTLSNGAVVAAQAGTDYLTAANIFGYPFPNNSTSTLIKFTGGASTSALTISNAINGILHTDATGNVSASSVSLTSDVNGILPIANGGTGSTTLTGILVGSSTLNSVRTLVVGSGLTFDGTTLATNGAGITAIGPTGQTQTGGTQILATSTAGTDFTITASGNTQTFNLPFASLTSTGKLAASDFANFNNKVSSSSLSGASVISYNSSTGVITTQGSTFGAGNYIFPSSTTVNGTSTVLTSALFGSTATSSFASNGALTLAQALNITSGGTGNTTYSPNSLLYFDGTKIAATSSGPLYVGALVATTSSATSTLSGGLAVANSLFVLQNGNIGIGNSTPTKTLEVTGTARVSSTFTLGANTSCTGGQALQTDVQGNVSCGTVTVSGASTGGGWTTSNNGFVTLATTSDEVAIGATSTPYAKLSILSGGAGTTTLALVPASGQTANILDIYDTANHLASVLTSASFLGLGTTSPSQQLSVQGNALLSGNLSTANIIATGTLSAGGTTLVTTAAGNVGIGTSSPTSLLSIAGGNITQTAVGSPSLATTVPEVGSDHAFNTYVSGHYAYVADFEGGLRILDVSNPVAPVAVGSNTSYTGSPTASAVVVAGKYAYLADQNSGLVIFDVSNTAAPVKVGSYAITGGSGAIALSGKYVFITDFTTGFVRVIDVSNPANPALAASLVSAAPTGLAVLGKYLYIADWTPAVYVADISNPTAPVRVGTFTTGVTSPTGLYIAGKNLYVADQDTGLYILDVSNPTSLSRVGKFPSSGPAHYIGVQVAGTYAYVADTTGKTNVFNVSTMSAPSLIGSLNSAGTPNGIFVAGKYAYLSDSASGLDVVDLNGATLPGANIGSLQSSLADIADNLNVGGDVYVGGGINAGASGIFTRGGLSVIGTTTLNVLTATLATTTQATTTNFAITGVTSSLLKTLTNGAVVAAVAGTDYLTAGTLPFAFTPTTFGATVANATSTLIKFNAGLASLASSTIGNGTQAGGLTINGGATTTGNAYFGNQVGIGMNPVAPSIGLSVATGIFTGFLSANNGAITQQLTDTTVYTPTGSLVGQALSGAGLVAANNDDDDGTYTALQLNARNSAATFQTGYFGAVSNTSGFTPDLVIGQQNSTNTYTERLRINAAGNLGVGTTSPYAELSVFAGSDFAAHAASILFAIGSTTAGTATSTLFSINSAGQINGLALNLTQGATSTALAVTGSTTLASLNSVVSNILGSTTLLGNSLFANATTTSFAISNIASGSLIKTTTGGALIAAVAGTDYVTPSQLFAYPFPNNATSTLLTFTNGINIADGSMYQIGGVAALFASSSNQAIAIGAPQAAAWMNASSTTWYDIAIGNGALGNTPTNAQAQNNTAIGALTLSSITTGSGNTAIGSSALHNNSTGLDNFALGASVLYTNTTGSYNVGIGTAALVENSSGSSNVAIGRLALQHNTTGGNNVVVGAVGLNIATSSSNNTIIGFGAGAAISGATGAVGNANTLVGNGAGGDITTGGFNTILGFFTSGASITTGGNNILIGQNVNSGLSQTGSNQLNIGNLLFGTGVSSDGTLSTGKIGIGTAAPSASLEIGAMSPTLRTKFSTGGNGPDGVVVRGNYAYVTNASTGLEIIDISDPSALNMLANNISGVNADQAGIDVQGRYAYLSDYGAQQLQIVDVSNPSNPFLVSTMPEPTGASGVGVQVVGKYAYWAAVGSGGRFNVVDVSNPSAPSVVGAVTLTANTGAEVSVQGNYAYVTEFGGAVHVIDISNPRNPILVSTLTDATYLAQPSGIVARGRYVYVTNLTSTSANACFTTIDVSTPASPVIVGHLCSAGSPNFLSNAVDVSVDGNYAYVNALSDNSLTVINIASSTNPTFAGRVVVSTGPYTDGASNSVAVVGKLAYVAQENDQSLAVVDLSGIETPGINAGSVAAGELQVKTNGVVGNNFSIGGGLNVGAGGIFSNGALSIVTASSTFSTLNALFNIQTASSSQPIFTALGNGTVGIGTTSPWKMLSVAGDIIGTNITATGTLQAVNIVSSASTTLASLNSVVSNILGSTTLLGNSLFANATTTSFAISNIASGNLLKTTSGGSILAAVAGTDYLTTATLPFTYPFPAGATTTAIAFNGGATFVGATTTALAVTGSTTISGQLNAFGTLKFANNSLTLAELPQIGANTVLVNNTSATGNVTAIATSTFFGTGTGGQVLTWSNGVPQWIASTTYANGAGISTAFANGQLTITNTIGYPFLNNATSTTLTFSNGLVSNGSTTISSLSSGLVGNNNGLLYGFASSSLFGFTPADQNRNINTTYPLQGGGDLTADRTLTLAFGTTTANTWSQLQTLTSGFLASASSTVNGGFTVLGSATTTNLAITGITSSLLKTNTLGQVVAAVAGTDYSNFGYPFIGNATTTQIAFNGGLTANGATTTALSVSGSSTLQLLNVGGVLNANGGIVASNITNNGVSANQLLYTNNSKQEVSVATSTATIGSGLNYTGTFGALVGGAAGTLSVSGLTGSNFANAGANTILANATGASGAPSFVATSSLFGTGTGGQVLAWSNGVPQWIASTTYANGAGISTAFANGQLTITNTIGYPFLSNATTTQLAFNGGATFAGATSTASFAVTGSSTISGQFNSVASNFLGSTTLLGNSLFTNATTTSFAISNIASGNLLKTTTNGSIIAAVAGTDYLTTATLPFTYPFPAGATTTQIAFNGGATFAGATSTALAVTGSTTISGQLNAFGTLKFANNSLTLAELPQIGANTVLVNNTSATGNVTAIATSSLFGTGTGGQVLAWSNGVPQWIASTTYANGAGISTAFANGQLTITNTGVTSLTTTYPLQTTGGSTPTLSLAFGTTTANTWNVLNTFSAGIIASASSTIGNGTQAGGLTISGGATTTGNAYVNGSLTTSAGNFNVDSSGVVTGTNFLVNNAGQFNGYYVKTGGNNVATLNGSAASNDNGQLGLYNAGVQQVNLLASGSSYINGGNLGVGTTSPFAKFSVFVGGNYTSQAASTAFAVGSSTAGTATSTLFSINSSGNSFLAGTASSTNVIASALGANAGQCVTVTSTGQLTTQACTTGGTGSPFPFTPGSSYGVTANATSTAIAFNAGVFASSTSHFAFADFGQLGFATTSNLLATLNGTSFITASTTGNNISVGLSALSLITSGSQNSAFGSQALSSLNTGADNVALGFEALQFATSSVHNIGIGTQALAGQVCACGGPDFSGSYNVGIGYQALVANTSGQSNVAIGDSQFGAVMTQNSTGSYNIALGGGALTNNTTGNSNVAIGGNLALNTTGSNNIGIGGGAGNLNTTGDQNVAIGQFALNSNMTGSNNTAVGNDVLGNLGSATSTVAVGAGAGTGVFDSFYHNQGGTYVGYRAGSILASGSDYNTLIGYNAGQNITSGANNIILGADTDCCGLFSNLSTGSNNIGIGNNITFVSSTTNNQLDIQDIIYGTNNAASAGGPSTGQIGIGSTTPFARFAIQANSGDVNTTLFAIGSSTASATTTLFSVSNTGNSFLLGTASSTSLIISGLGASAGQCLTTTSSGSVTSTSCGTGGGGTFSWTPTTNFGALANSTSTPIWFTAGLQASSTSQFANVNVFGTLAINGGSITYGANATSTIPNNTPYAWTVATSTTAAPLIAINTTSGSESVSIGAAGSDVYIGDTNSSPNLVFQNSSTIKTASGGTLTFGAGSDIINFAVNTGFGSTSPWKQLSVGSGNTGTFAISTSTAGCAQFSLNGELYSTGTACGSGSGGFPFTPFSATAVSTTSGLMIFASSTVGNGTQASGLYISGGATTTGSAYVAGQLSVNDTTPEFKFETTGAAVNGYFGVTSIWGNGSNDGDLFNINNNGNVGIGTTSAYARFGIQATSTTGVNSPTTLFAIASSTKGTSTTTLLALMNNGTFAIGTSSPFASLTFVVASTSLHNNTAFVVASTSSSGATTNFLTISNTGSTTIAGLLNATSGGFLNITSATTSALSVTASSTIGGAFNSVFANMLGSTTLNGNTLLTNATSSIFAVTGIASTSNLVISNIANGSGQCLQINATGQVTGTGAVCGGTGTAPVGSSGQLQYNNGGVFGGTAGFTYSSSNQFVGVGSTTPWGQLSVNSNAIGTAPEFVVGSSTATNFIVANNGFVGVGTTTPWARFSVDTSNLGATGVEFAVGSSTRTDFVIKQNGNYAQVGIGTSSVASTSPALVVQGGTGTSQRNVAAFYNGLIGCSISPISGSASCSSDQRLKKDFNSISATSSLAGVLQLSPTFYNWNFEDDGNPQHSGFIAQAVEQIFPDIVTTDSVTGYLQLNYAGFTPYLAGAIQAQQQEIAAIASSSATFPQLAIANGSVVIGTGATSTIALNAGTITLGVASTSVVTFNAGTINFRAPTSTIVMSNGIFAIATSSATGTLPIFSIAAPASSTPTVSINGNFYLNGQDVTSIASTSATTTVAALVQGPLASATDAFKSTVTSALNALQNIAQNGVRQLGAAVYATVGTFNSVFTQTLTATDINADTVNANKLCLGNTCVTEQQLQQLLNGGAGNAQASGGGSGSSGGTSGSSTSTPPTITINGANPANITVGDSYSDLGATATDNQGTSLGVHTFVNGTLTEPVVIDTSAVGTSTIDYVATDTWGNTATSTRTVIINTAQ